ncbi:MAG: hypothetical protein ACYC0V_19610 [Armatimonadota bacterium]
MNNYQINAMRLSAHIVEKEYEHHKGDYVMSGAGVPSKKIGFLSKECKQCGTEIKMGRLMVKTLCQTCIDRNDNELKITLGKIIRMKNIDNESISTLQKCNRNILMNNFGYLYDAFISDAELQSEEIDLLTTYRTKFGLSEDEVKWNERIQPYIYVASIKNNNRLPMIDVESFGSAPPILKKGEIIHFSAEASLKEIKTVKLGYAGGSHGVSIRVMKGVSYRVGSNRGHIMKEEQLVETSSGTLLITNQRIFLHPHPGNKPLSIPLKDLVSYQCYSNGMEIYKSGREKGYFLYISNPWEAEIVSICLQYLLNNYE